jgi:asparagine N-glycosylation enzyme membrane subunit Stt3
MNFLTQTALLAATPPDNIGETFGQWVLHNVGWMIIAAGFVVALGLAWKRNYQYAVITVVACTLVGLLALDLATGWNGSVMQSIVNFVLSLFGFGPF